MRKDELPNFHDIATDVKSISTDRGWKTFFLMGFGTPSERNIALCPKTWAAVQNIPGLKTAMFSIFEPGKHLAPHRGPYNGVLRLHLGIDRAGTERSARHPRRQADLPLAGGQGPDLRRCL